MISFEYVNLTNFDPPLKKFHDQTDAIAYTDGTYKVNVFEYLFKQTLLYLTILTQNCPEKIPIYLKFWIKSIILTGSEFHFYPI